MRLASPNPIDAPGTDEATWHAWPELGHLPVADSTGWASAVILAAHPDDEVLGVGGTMSLLASAGARLRLVAVTDGEASHPGTARQAVDALVRYPRKRVRRLPDQLAERRVAETAAAVLALGAQDAEVVRLRLPDTGSLAERTRSPRSCQV